ncbi:MAG: hypothetical protein OXC46_03060 [Thaumarchaeota archaeon]|nr:hypothetical protein [Nitrososphaerota archaeon]
MGKMKQNRHNQYRNKITKQRGSVDMDMDDKLRVKHIISKLLPDFTICLNWFVWKNSKGDVAWKEYVSYDESQDCHHLTRPDVLAMAKYPYVQGARRCGFYIFAIEIDGAVHKGDARRQRRYNELRIPAIIVNKADLDYLDMTWANYIEDQLTNLGIYP